MPKNLSYYVTVLDLEGAEYSDGSGFVPIDSRYYVTITKAVAESEHLVNKFGIDLFEAIVMSPAHEGKYNERISWRKE